MTDATDDPKPGSSPAAQQTAGDSDTEASGDDAVKPSGRAPGGSTKAQSQDPPAAKADSADAARGKVAPAKAGSAMSAPAKAVPTKTAAAKGRSAGKPGSARKVPLKAGSTAKTGVTAKTAAVAASTQRSKAEPGKAEPGKAEPKDKIDGDKTEPDEAGAESEKAGGEIAGGAKASEGEASTTQTTGPNGLKVVETTTDEPAPPVESGRFYYILIVIALLIGVIAYVFGVGRVDRERAVGPSTTTTTFNPRPTLLAGQPGTAEDLARRVITEIPGGFARTPVLPSGQREGPLTFDALVKTYQDPKLGGIFLRIGGFRSGYQTFFEQRDLKATLTIQLLAFDGNLGASEFYKRTNNDEMNFSGNKRVDAGGVPDATALTSMVTVDGKIRSARQIRLLRGNAMITLVVSHESAEGPPRVDLGPIARSQAARF